MNKRMKLGAEIDDGVEIEPYNVVSNEFIRKIIITVLLKPFLLKKW